MVFSRYKQIFYIEHIPTFQTCFLHIFSCILCTEYLSSSGRIVSLDLFILFIAQPFFFPINLSVSHLSASWLNGQAQVTFLIIVAITVVIIHWCSLARLAFLSQLNSSSHSCKSCWVLRRDKDCLLLFQLERCCNLSLWGRILKKARFSCLWIPAVSSYESFHRLCHSSLICCSKCPPGCHLLKYTCVWCRSLCVCVHVVRKELRQQLV